jgi:hypothetical protein
MERAENGGTERRRPRERILQGHLLIYLMFSLFFIFINFVTWSGTLWFFWPMVGWGMVLMLHSFAVYGPEGPLELVDLLRFWTARALPPPPPMPPAPAPPMSRQRSDRTEETARSQPTPPAAVGRLIAEGETKVDAMRAQARRIPKVDVRDRALDVCASADRILAALAEKPSEGQLASDFVARYLTPAEAIISRYTRLVTRGVGSAEPTLTRVEEADLPLLDGKFKELYERLHRGDLIDLEVAREMLALDFAAAEGSTSSGRGKA